MIVYFFIALYNKLLAQIKSNKVYQQEALETIKYKYSRKSYTNYVMRPVMT